MPDSFQRAARFAPLQAGDMHVWRIPLVTSASAQLRLRDTLSRDERERGDRYIFERHRHQFTVGRARVREILAAYSGHAPADLVFDYAALGKPRLSNVGAECLKFNFSNSHELGLLAVTTGVEIGVDLEWQRALSDLAALAQRFFHPAEIRVIDALEGEAQRQAFFRCWTRKEAYLKAIGKGLSFPLCRVQVTVEHTAPARIDAIDNQPTRAVDWRMWHLVPARGYIGALACEGYGERLVPLDYERSLPGQAAR